MSKFFIYRPIFAWVVAILIMATGGLCIFLLPVEQYPDVAAPRVSISATYPGASAETVEDSVVQIIEQKMTGLDHLRYMESSSSSNGTATINLTFEVGTDPDIAQVQVQNKVQSASGMLPQQVQNQGITVRKASDSMLMVLALVSEDGKMGSADISDYFLGNLQDTISRISGVGDVRSFGSQYAMRIWLDPAKLMQYKLNSEDVKNAITDQNAQVSSGSLGADPAVKGHLIDATIVTQGRMEDVSQFENILLKVNENGSKVLLKDVARVELGSESYSMQAEYNHQPASGFGISLAPGANALDTVSAVKAKMDELKPSFPTGLKVIYPVDTTAFVHHSISEVVKTLIEAVILVFFVMYLFLGNIRATLVPTLAVPVVLLGTFGVLAIAGYSINTLTLFGLVLGIGLLVDDAIVVVENVERVMQEDGLPAREATVKSMKQISGALVGIGIVLCAAFAPMAFLGSSTGVIYRQFSITLATSVALSVVVALIFSPALCATLLKPGHQGDAKHQRGFFGWFNRGFNRIAERYSGAVRFTLHRVWVLLAAYLVIIAGVVLMFKHLPTSFLPEEDSGEMMTLVQLPTGATSEQTQAVLKRVQDIYINQISDSIEGVFAVTGFSFVGSGQNQAMVFAHLKDWSEREGKGQSIQEIQQRAMGAFSQIKEARVIAMIPPAVRQLGNTNGFDFRLMDNAGLGHEALIEAQQKLIQMASQRPEVQNVRSNNLEDKPQLRLDINFEKAGALGLNIGDIKTELSNIFGSSYVNDFIDRGRVKKVYLEGAADYRMTPDDIDSWYIRNGNGEMVPFSAFISSQWELGSTTLSRFNGKSSVAISGVAAPGYSSGAAMEVMANLAKELPAGITFEWAGLSYEENLAGSRTGLLYTLSLFVVFMCLAALYENWAIPVSVLMDMPLGALGVLSACFIRNMPNDVYFQIGLITIIGLSAKNAILVVEFAKEAFDEGATLIEATVHAVRQRLRPIMMTSIAFGLGTLPLALSTGAGAGAQNAVGTGIVGGAITTTLLGLFFVPFYFVTVMRLFRVKPKKPLEPAVG
ncbi:efflux RND transporter permease subunit [Luteolibacter pohnpeiensis]|uniref:Efflux RND transporter permease subunit n=1 Tax=Luteolibacter pohnpeiensis TaxID=454153 RepID=A0A934VUS7_9BACT|nr:efflux RND transporter permease subunit [Luteolibacter pohnpeiensis]MBK1880819.1 efflux RND transporter permease subunit [Luteolibacter pohnpeiensis]